MHEVFQNAKEKKKTYRSAIYAMVLGFAIVCLAAVLLDAFLPFSAFVIFPFFVLSYYVAMQMMITQLGRMEFSRSQFKTFKRMTTFSTILRSPYKSLFHVVMAALIKYFLTFLIIAIFLNIPAYHDFIVEFSKIVFSLDGRNVNDAIMAFAKANQEQYNFVFFITDSVSYGVAYLYFMFMMLHNGLYALCENNVYTQSGNKSVFLRVFKKYKGSYYKLVFAKEWYKILLILILFAGGFVLAYFLGLLNYGVPIATGLSVIGVCLLLPDLLLFQEQTCIVMQKELQEHKRNDIQKQYNDISDKLNEDQKKELDAFIDNLNKTLNGMNSQDKDDDSDDEKKDS